MASGYIIPDFAVVGLARKQKRHSAAIHCRAVALSAFGLLSAGLLHVAHLAIFEGDLHAVVVINGLGSKVGNPRGRTHSRLHLVLGLAHFNGCGRSRSGRSSSGGSRIRWRDVCSFATARRGRLGGHFLLGLLALLVLLLNLGGIAGIRRRCNSGIRGLNRLGLR